jgi:chemotaxis protein CheD
MDRKDLIEIFLQPGEYFTGDARYRIRTLLGSCVSITLWHPRMRIGAMSHFLLARRTSRSSSELDGRYGDEALCLMLRELAQSGVRPQECEGKIFGGGDMFPSRSRVRGDGMNVGKRNGEMARELLHAHGIAVVSESLFGVGHRQVIFDVASGNVWLRQVPVIGSDA